MRVAVLNGPNLNLLGEREPEIYGRTTLAEIEAMVRAEATDAGIELEWTQSNHEGVLVDAIQSWRGRVDGALVNGAAFTHTSMAMRDALLGVKVPFVEVHLSNLFAREAARQHSHFASAAIGVITGFGAESYRLGLRALLHALRAR